LVAQGFVDRARQRLIFGSLGNNEVVNAGREALKLFAADRFASSSREEKVAVSDSGEIVRDANRGVLQVSTAQFVALCGDLSAAKNTVAKSGITVSGARRGVLVALSLDGLPLSESRRFLIKMVTNTRNRDQEVGRDARYLRNAQGQWKVTKLGIGPVESAKMETTSTRLRVAIGRKSVIVQARGGWELLIEGDKTQFYSDMAGATFQIVR